MTSGLAPEGAAEIQASITDLSVSHTGATIGDSVRITAGWSIPDGAQPGDTFSVQLPPELTPVQTEFDLLDGETVVVHSSQRGQLKQLLLKLGWPAEDFAGYVDGTPHPIVLAEDGWTLRPYQKLAVENFWAGGSGVVVLPCGAGKTLVGAAALAHEPGPKHVYARMLVDALDPEARKSLWQFCSMVGRSGGHTFLEFRTPESRHERKFFGHHIRTYAPASVIAAEVSARGGTVVRSGAVDALLAPPKALPVRKDKARPAKAS